MTRTRPNPVTDHRVNFGFTLIELLVVVAIIVALLAILMPSMNRAIVLAQRTTCAAHLHQIAIAQISYAADNFGQLTHGTPSQALIDQVGDSGGVWSIWKKTMSAKSNDGWKGNGVLHYAGYIKSGEVFYCPAWDHPYYEYRTEDPVTNKSWPAGDVDPNTTGQTGLRQTYHSRNTFDLASGFTGRPARVSLDSGGSAILADGFVRTTGDAQLQQIPGVMMHHREGYNVARLDASMFWYDDTDLVIGSQLINHVSGGRVAQEAVWDDHFSGGLTP